MRAAVALSALFACASAQSAWEPPNSKHWKYATDIRDAGTYATHILVLQQPQVARRTAHSLRPPMHVVSGTHAPTVAPSVADQLRACAHRLDKMIDEAVSSDKTLFVRFIASDG